MAQSAQEIDATAQITNQSMGGQTPPQIPPQIPRKFSLPPLPPIPKLKLPIILAFMVLLAVGLILATIIIQYNKNRVVKTQDGITVTVKEAQEELDRLNKIRALSKGGPDSNLEPAIGVNIARKKLESEAKKRGLTISDREIEEEIKNFSIFSSAGRITAENIEDFGWSESELRDWARTKLLYQKLNDEVGTWREYQLIQLSLEDDSKVNLIEVEEILKGAIPRLENGEDFAAVAESIKVELPDGLNIYFTTSPIKGYDSSADDVSQSLGEKAAFIEALRESQKASILKEQGVVALYFVMNYHEGDYKTVAELIGGIPW